MATLRSSIAVTDNLSPAIRSMSSAMNILVGGFERLQTASNNPIDINSMRLARDQIARAEANINQMESEINRANQQQQRLNRSFGEGENKARNLLNSIKSFVGAYVGIQSAREFIGITDQNTGNKARLDMINDGLQTQAELQEKIFKASQRSRSSYLDTIGVVAKLGMLSGEAFKNNNEMIKFSELMGKTFALSGASTQERQAGMYQLTQAMAAGKLQGDEFRSIMENAPMLAQAIADFTGKSKGELKEMSSQGTITADIIKGALFNAADKIEDRYKNMPLTFGAMWTQIKNQAIFSLDGVMTKLNQAINTQDGKNLMAGITSSLIVFGTVLGTVLSLAVQFGSMISTNWGWIGPIIYGLVTAMLALNVAIGINNLIMGVSGGIQAFSAAMTAWKTASTLADVAATELATGAQIGLNTAMLASPIGLVIMGIIALIMVTYAVVGAINYFAGTSISATGVIFGVFAWLVAGILNLFIGLGNFLITVWNGVVSGAEWVSFAIQNTFIMAINLVIRAFQAMANNVLGTLRGIASVMDKVFDTDVAGKIGGLQSKINGIELKASVQKQSFAGAKMQTGDFINMKDAYGMGYNFGEGLGKKAKGAFNLDNNKFKFDGLDTSKFDPSNNLGKIADNTKKAADKADKKVEIDGEDLKYMRDIAERAAINTAINNRVKVEMFNNNNINNEMDLDGIINHLVNGTEEALIVSAEGVSK